MQLVSLFALCHLISASAFILPHKVVESSRQENGAQIKVRKALLASKAPVENSDQKEKSKHDVTKSSSSSSAKTSSLFKLLESDDHKETETETTLGIEKEVESEADLQFGKLDENDDIGNKNRKGGLQFEQSPETKTEPQVVTSLGSFLLKRKQIEEEEIKKTISRDGDASSIASKKMPDSKKEQMRETGKELKIETDSSSQSTGIDATDVQKEFDEALQTFVSDAETTIASFIDSYNQIPVVGEDKKQKRAKKAILPKLESGIDMEQVREVDESVSIITGSGSEIGKKELLKDIQILPGSRSSTPIITIQKEDGKIEHFQSLPLSDARHIARIELDMRRLAVSIASGIESEDQWKAFCADGGGVLPLLECIRDSAREIRQGPIAIREVDESILGLVEEREASFQAACKACKTLRDLCVISKDFSAVITDSILRADSFWAKSNDSKSQKEHLSGGLISDLVLLLKHSAETDKLYKYGRNSKTLKNLRSRGLDVMIARRKRRVDRQRCALYVAQLLLAMSFASDKAVDRLRATSGLTDAILSCSSYAQKERLRRRWIRYPIEIIKRKLGKVKLDENNEDPFLAAVDLGGGITGQIQGTSNQLLAAIGHNEWYPKTAGQRGLRILCLDGGGTRGITAISSMRSIVAALGGVEVCDAFDMVVGTSTGAIIAFLVGLRRESSKLARKRYDKLIKRIFVKSALSAPMLLFTTATYDESPFNQVMSSILRDNSMLSSRSDPRVPLVFAISSKMSSTPTQLCLFRNYNYSGGEMSDAFVQDPVEAKEELDLPLEDDIYNLCGKICYDENLHENGEKASQGSRHPGSFRVLQRAALRATTAAPTVFKPVLMSGELYCDGGIVASNPAAVAIHEARTIFPHVPIEMVVSCGTGAFVEEKSEPRIGWDGIIGQIVNSATDGEQTHHILEDILGQGSTTHLGKSSVSKTKYYRFNPVIGTADTFPIDGTDPIKLEELSEITTAYMNEPEQKARLDEIASILHGQRGWKRIFSRRS